MKARVLALIPAAALVIFCAGANARVFNIDHEGV